VVVYLLNMTDQSFEHLEESLRTLGKGADLSFAKKQAIRDRVFRMVGQVELADAIIEGKQKASVLVSLKSLKKALLPDKISFSMPVTVAMMMLVFASSVITGALAQGARPTDVLFPVKKVLESIELAFISNPVSKAKATLNIADERMRHLESSADSGEALVKVLKESQIALVNARVALEKVTPKGGSNEPANILVDRFSALLNDQKAILSAIDKKEESEDVKKAVVAIREALGEKSTNTSGPDTDKISNTISSRVSEEVTIPTSGFMTLNGTIGSYTAQPVILVKDKRYFLVGSTIDLIPYMGSAGAVVTGYLKDGVITLSKLTISGQLIWEKPANTNFAIPADNWPLEDRGRN